MSTDESLRCVGSLEQRALILLTMLDATDSWRDETRGILSHRLDWCWIFAQAAKHKVLHLLWDRLVLTNLVGLAIERAGMPKLQTVYLEQLSWINTERNKVFLESAERLFEAFRDSKLAAVCLKGGALIGSQYSMSNRMLHDVDVMVAAAARKDVIQQCLSLGYCYGAYDPVARQLNPISERKMRFWNFYNHALPALFIPTGTGHTPFVKLSIGFDFFDHAEEYHFPSDLVVKEARPKASDSAIQVPSPHHMLINLCVHIFREGVSAVYAQNADNWQMIKFCDLRTFLRMKARDIDWERFKTEVVEFDLARPIYYALHHTYRIYGDPFLRESAGEFEPSDRAYLDEVVDGKRRDRSPRSFFERLFETTSALPEGLSPTWYREFVDSDW